MGQVAEGKVRRWFDLDEDLWSQLMDEAWRNRKLGVEPRTATDLIRFLVRKHLKTRNARGFSRKVDEFLSDEGLQPVE